MELVELSTDHLSDPAQHSLIATGGIPRPGGMHVSNVINDIDRRVIHRDRKAFDDLTSAERKRMGQYVAGGWSMEPVFESAIKSFYMNYYGAERFMKTGPLYLDGLVGTPDLFDVDDYLPIEMKVTWRSSRRSITENFWTWHAQMKSYAKMTASNQAKLIVFFVNGNYRDSGPQLKMWCFTYTPDELKANWTMILKHRDVMIREQEETNGSEGENAADEKPIQRTEAPGHRLRGIPKSRK